MVCGIYRSGHFFVEYIIPIGSGISDSLAIFNNMGDSITDRNTIDYLVSLLPELKDFNIKFNSDAHTASVAIIQDTEEIVEVRGSPRECTGILCSSYLLPK